jgi:hypothetical protein
MESRPVACSQLGAIHVSVLFLIIIFFLCIRNGNASLERGAKQVFPWFVVLERKTVALSVQDLHDIETLGILRDGSPINLFRVEFGITLDTVIFAKAGHEGGITLGWFLIVIVA